MSDHTERRLHREPDVERSSVTTVEQHGIESIPDVDRDASIFDFMRLCWGGANSLATAVLGAFPIMFGLSFWQATAATVLGLIVGSLVLAPMSIFGPINGTNNAVSSSAHFGVVGRIVGSFLSLLTAIAFFAISVWSSGDAVVGAAHAVFRVRGSDTEIASVYAVFAVSVLIVCIYGFRMMLLINKIAVVASTALFRSGRFLEPLRSQLRGIWSRVGCFRVLAAVHQLYAGRAGESYFLRRISGRLDALPAAQHEQARARSCHRSGPIAYLTPVSIRCYHGLGGCQTRPGLSRTRRLHGRTTYRGAVPVLGANARACGIERYVYGYDLAIRNRARLLQCFSAS